MDEPAIIWRHGHPWREVEGGQYLLDAEAETLGRVRLQAVAVAAWMLYGNPTTGDWQALWAALKAAGFDVVRGEWRTGDEHVENIWCGLCGTYVQDMDHHHIGGQSRGGVT